jgi:predicted ATPase
MDLRSALVGRKAERARLSQAIESARRGTGGLLLLSGEAGIGKTRLTEEVATASSALVLRGAASNSAVTPYGPLVAVLRSYLRSRPDGLEGCAALRSHLALLLPELGEQAPASDRATIFEAVRCALAAVAGEGPVIVVLDDLQWSDGATLELLAGLRPTLDEMPMLVVAAYRSDGLPRDHTVRWLRNELRRGGGLDELVLGPLDRAETARLLAELLPGSPSPSLVRALHDRTTRIAMRPAQAVRRWSCGTATRRPTHGSRCWSATPAAPSWPASWPRR